VSRADFFLVVSADVSPGDPDDPSLQRQLEATIADAIVDRLADTWPNCMVVNARVIDVRQSTETDR
jgi:hypothetical protein